MSVMIPVNTDNFAHSRQGETSRSIINIASTTIEKERT